MSAMIHRNDDHRQLPEADEDEGVTDAPGLVEITDANSSCGNSAMRISHSPLLDCPLSPASLTDIPI